LALRLVLARHSRIRGLRRQDTEANIRAANGPKGELRMQLVNDEQETGRPALRRLKAEPARIAQAVLVPDLIRRRAADAANP
jgi:hypothetical protein